MDAPGELPLCSQRPASRPERWVINRVSGRSPKMIGIEESPLPGADSMLLPLSWKEAAGGTRGQVPRAALGTARRAQRPATALGDTREGLEPLCGAREGAPGRMDGRKAGNAERGAGRKRGRGRKAAPGSGLGGKAEEERRKGSRPPRWRRRKAGPGRELSRCTLSPRGGRGRDTAVPAVAPRLARSRPWWGCRSRRAPCRPHLGTGGLVGHPKRGDREPLGHPFGGRGGDAVTRGDSDPPGVWGGFGVFYIPLEFWEGFWGLALG